MKHNPCPVCNNTRHSHDKGRAPSGKRAWRCKLCGVDWIKGSKGRRRQFSRQRTRNQFKDTGASKWE